MRSAILTVGVVLALAPAAGAEEPSVWLDRMAVFYERVDFSTEFELTGQLYGLTVRGSGKILYKDERHQRMDAQVGMGFPGLGDALAGTITEVRDGTHLWSEVAVGPEAEVFKERLEPGAGGGAGRFSELGRSMNPISELRAIREYAAFDTAERTADMVLLRGRFLPPVLEETAVTDVLGPEPEIRLGLRPGDAAPLLLSLGPPAGPPVATLRLQDLQRLDADRLPAGAFSYTPPPGTEVNEKQGGR